MGAYPKKEEFIKYLKAQTKSRASIKSRSHDVELFFRKFDKVNTRNIQGFVNRQIDEGLDPKTVIRRVGSLKKYAEFLDIPLGKINVPKPKYKVPDIISEAELRKIYNDAMKITPDEGIDRMTIKVMIILFNYMIRRQGVLDIKESDIDLENDLIKIHNKGGDEIVKPLVFGKEAIKEYIELKRKYNINIESLLVRRYRNEWKPLQEREMYQMLYEFTEQSIGKKVKPHSFRHSIATSMLDNGADLRSLQEALNHKNLSTTQFYTHLSQEHNKSFIKKFHPIIKG